MFLKIEFLSFKEKQNIYMKWCDLWNLLPNNPGGKGIGRYINKMGDELKIF